MPKTRPKNRVILEKNGKVGSPVMIMEFVSLSTNTELPTLENENKECACPIDPIPKRCPGVSPREIFLKAKLNLVHSSAFWHDKLVLLINQFLP